MDFILNAYKNFCYWFSCLSYDSLAVFLIACFLGVFVLALILCALSPKIRSADKKPFFHLLNAFTAVSLALFVRTFELTGGVARCALFWCVGYMLYGLLCALTPKQKSGDCQINVSQIEQVQPRQFNPTGVPVAKSSVKLEHALSLSDKLLIKNLAKGDRQELEKIKTTLTILQVKGTLSPQECEILNDSFAALLKLMAKYNL
jgi:hypothetical protein